MKKYFAYEKKRCSYEHTNADADREPDNLIRVPKGSEPLLDGKAAYLYKSDFGDISNIVGGRNRNGHS